MVPVGGVLICQGILRFLRHANVFQRPSVPWACTATEKVPHLKSARHARQAAPDASYAVIAGTAAAPSARRSAARGALAMPVRSRIQGRYVRLADSRKDPRAASPSARHRAPAAGRRADARRAPRCRFGSTRESSARWSCDPRQTSPPLHSNCNRPRRGTRSATDAAGVCPPTGHARRAALCAAHPCSRSAACACPIDRPRPAIATPRGKKFVASPATPKTARNMLISGRGLLPLTG